MDRLRELLGFGNDDADVVDIQARSTEDLKADADAVREALSNRDELSLDEIRQTVAYGKAVLAELEARDQLDADIDVLTAEPVDVEPADEAPAAEAKPAKVADVERPAAAAPADDQPVAEADDDEEALDPEAVLVAAAGPAGSPLGDGSVIESAEALGQAMQAAWNGTTAPRGGGSVRHRAFGKRWNLPFVVDPEDKASRAYGVVRAAFDAEQEKAKRQVFAGNGQESMLAIQAASGICGPLDPRYSFLQLASATAGIIGLPQVQANRGGLRLPQAVTAYDLRAEEGIADEYTSADGAAGVTKATYTVACPTISDFEITAWQTNIRFSNFQGQFFPEYVAHVTEVSMAQHSHVVNAALIDAIIASADTTSYAVGAAEQASAWASFTRQVTFHTWLYRDKYATSQDLILDVVISYRALGALIADTAAHDSTRVDEAAFAVAAKLANFGQTVGVRFQFVYDYQPMVDTPGDFGSEDYEFLVFPAGEVLHMTAATLDLGVVRDSTRNAQNEFDTWTETFDGIATAGYEIMRITGMDLCPNGETGARVTITCGTGS